MKTLKRRLKRRFGIAAPRMAVRTHLPWHWRWAIVAVLVGLFIIFAQQIFDAGMRMAGFAAGETRDELSQLRVDVARLRQENAAFRASATAAERQLQIEGAAQKDLEKSLKTLQEENTRLREDLAFFQTLMPGNGMAEKLSLHQFKVEKGLLPGEYRYRLLVLQGGSRDREFRGRLQLLVTVAGEDGRKSVVEVKDTAAASPLRLSFKYYQRVEGTFQVSSGAVVKSVQARVLEAGTNQPKLMQTFNLP